MKCWAANGVNFEATVVRKKMPFSWGMTKCGEPAQFATGGLLRPNSAYPKGQYWGRLYFLFSPHPRMLFLARGLLMCLGALYCSRICFLSFNLFVYDWLFRPDWIFSVTFHFLHSMFVGKSRHEAKSFDALSATWLKICPRSNFGQMRITVFCSAKISDKGWYFERFHVFCRI